MYPDDPSKRQKKAEANFAVAYPKAAVAIGWKYNREGNTPLGVVFNYVVL